MDHVGGRMYEVEHQVAEGVALYLTKNQWTG